MFLDKTRIHTDYLRFKYSRSLSEYLLSASFTRHCSRPEGYRNEQDKKPCPAGFFVLVNEIYKQERQMKGRHTHETISVSKEHIQYSNQGKWMEINMGRRSERVDREILLKSWSGLTTEGRRS